MRTKATLRQAALARRRTLPADEVTRRSDKLCERLFRQFPVVDWRWLHLFLPLTRRSEPDTWPIIRRVWCSSIPLRLAVPVVQADGESLRHYELTPDSQFTQNRWGIDEPIPDPVSAPEVSPALPDAVLVPLLAFDTAGHRVGYGGGFYDRFLAQCRPDCAFIGLSVLDEPPVSAIADVLPTDIRLTACLTPGGVWKF